ncbi:MAG: class I SAM-dependent RNA methyltransferase [Epulopiscium sp.]|mgnify:CR=1 FL=1|nr:class I SAM-dependent RNA methyltransferase [Candidatus Epulonipiscium sp.]
MKIFDLIATSTFGIEAIVRREVEDLGYNITNVSDGKVTYTADAEGIALSNLWLRSADRVLLKMGEFKATSFEALYNLTYDLPWEKWITQDAKFTVTGKSVKSGLYSVPDCQSIVKKAIVDRLSKHYNIKWFPETGPEYTVQVSILKDIATLTIDTTGSVGLHKRGYRDKQGGAPLKETLAAALIQISYWNKDRTLYDPFCGSGTIPIEAAMIARNIAPGLNREFASSHWPQLGDKLWKEVRQEAYDSIDLDTKLSIHASDIDRHGISVAKENAASAGVDDCISFFVKSVHKSQLPRYNYGVVITNPPYGKRLSEREQVQELHKSLANMLNTDPTWSSYIITSQNTLESDFGKKVNKRRKLFNGRIPVEFYQYFGPRPPRKE